MAAVPRGGPANFVKPNCCYSQTNGLVPAYRRSIREEGSKTLEQPHLERAACKQIAEAGQLWGVTGSELRIFADRMTRNYCRLKEDG